jgi:hypothetical protein
MKTTAGALHPEPILVDDAHSFGVGVWEPGKRGKGVLYLTGEALIFVPAGRGTALEIPLGEITGLGTAARNGAPAARNVLRITYSGNLVLGLAVEEPQRWVNAIDALTRGRGQKTILDKPLVTRLEMHRFRVVVAMILLLLVLVSTALPLFFTWINARVNDAPGPAFSPEDASSVAF